MPKRSIVNLFNAPKSNVQFSEGQKSKGILDDYPVRQAIFTEEMESKGYSIRLTAGGNLVKGNVLRASKTSDNSVIKAGVTDGENGRDMPVGIALHAATSGSKVLLIIAGVADILSEGNVARGDFLSTSDTISGAAKAAAVPEVPSTAEHWREIGHALESRTGAGLFKGIVHFN